MSEPGIPERDVQALVASGGGRRLPVAAFVFVRFPDDAARGRAWLAGLVDDVAPADRAARADRAWWLQLAFAVDGLRALGLDPEVCDRFPQEAKLGMHRRSRTLGDEGDNAPSRWTIGGPDHRLDAVVLVMAGGAPALDAQLDRLRGHADAHGVVEVACERSAPWRPTEPFGYTDGLSQPHLLGSARPPRRGQDTIAAGEILLGHLNGYGRLPQSPRDAQFDYGANGTFLVFRKLEQDVAGFWRCFRDRARALAGEPPVPADPARATEWLAARAMGRWRNGASLVTHPDAPPADVDPDQLDVFSYLPDDARGTRCPIASHVRRANPRDARGGSAAESRTVSNRHRLLRRGRAFGPLVEPADIDALIAGGELAPGPRGLLFVGLCASIARGFEFIQQTWLANPGFHALFDEPDPVVGPGGGGLTIPADPVRLRLSGLPRFVTVRGGGYFFLPSLPALRRIARV